MYRNILEPNYPIYEFLAPSLIIDYMKSIKKNEKIEDVTHIKFSQYDPGDGVQPSIRITYSSYRTYLGGDKFIEGQVFETSFFSVMCFMYKKLTK